MNIKGKSNDYKVDSVFMIFLKYPNVNYRKMTTFAVVHMIRITIRTIMRTSNLMVIIHYNDNHE